MLIMPRSPININIGEKTGSIDINAVILHRKGSKIAKNSSKMTFFVIIIITKVIAKLKVTIEIVV